MFDKKVDVKRDKTILKDMEKFFNLEKGKLTNSQMPTERLIEMVFNPTKESKEYGLKLLGFNPNDPTKLQSLDNFLKNYI